MKARFNIRTVGALLFGAAMSVSAWASGMKPLGLEIGRATLEESRSKLPGARWGQQEVNRWSAGPIVGVDPQSVDIDGLQELTLIFTKDKVLAAVLMTIDKSRAREVMNILRSRYKVEKEVVPFVGDVYGRYRAGRTLAILEAPHMSFSMTVLYADDDFYRSYQKMSQEAEQRHKRAQAEKF